MGAVRRVSRTLGCGRIPLKVRRSWSDRQDDRPRRADLSQRVCRTAHTLRPPVEYVRVDHRRADVGVTEQLQGQYPFYVWDPPSGVVRWMTSFDTTEQDVDQFVGLVAGLMGESRP